MIKIRDLLLYGKQYIVSPQCEAILCNLMNINSFELLDSKDKFVNKLIENKFKVFVKEIYDTKKSSKVIPYINFCDLKFELNDNVLLPHFETQEVVVKTSEYIKKLFNGNCNLIDLGCGSGVIGLTLKNNFNNLRVELIDISDEALEVTRRNAKSLDLDVDIYKSNMLDNVNSKFDIIISNPPYESKKYKPILDNEPAISLYAGDEGLYFYNLILKNVKKNLKEKFMIVFEVGDYQKEKVINLVNKYLNNVVIKSLESKKGFEKSIYIFGGFTDLDLI